MAAARVFIEFSDVDDMPITGSLENGEYLAILLGSDHYTLVVAAGYESPRLEFRSRGMSPDTLMREFGATECLANGLVSQESYDFEMSTRANRSAAAKSEQERTERATLATLKAKYEGK